MDHVPLPQRPPRKQRARATAAEVNDDGGRDASGAAASAAAAAAARGAFSSCGDDRRVTKRSKPSSGGDRDHTVDEEEPAHEGRDVEEKDGDDDEEEGDACPHFVPGVKIVDGLKMASQYEYRDHTADIQIHSWGDSVEECFAWAAIGMFNYMTPLERLASSAAEANEVGHSAGAEGGRVPGNANMHKGDGGGDGDRDGNGGDEENRATAAASAAGAAHDHHAMHGHAFEVEAHDMQSLLFAFLDELLFTFHTSMLVCRQIQVGVIDRQKWRVRCVGRGEKFVDGVHEQGTEIKAITYSAMQIVEHDSAAGCGGRGGGVGHGGGPSSGGVPSSSSKSGSRAELFVIVDI